MALFLCRERRIGWRAAWRAYMKTDLLAQRVGLSGVSKHKGRVKLYRLFQRRRGRVGLVHTGFLGRGEYVAFGVEHMRVALRGSQVGEHGLKRSDTSGLRFSHECAREEDAIEKSRAHCGFCVAHGTLVRQHSSNDKARGQTSYDQQKSQEWVRESFAQEQKHIHHLFQCIAAAKAAQPPVQSLHFRYREGLFRPFA